MSGSDGRAREAGRSSAPARKGRAGAVPAPPPPSDFLSEASLRLELLPYELALRMRSVFDAQETDEAPAGWLERSVRGLLSESGSSREVTLTAAQRQAASSASSLRLRKELQAEREQHQRAAAAAQREADAAAAAVRAAARAKAEAEAAEAQQADLFSGAAAARGVSGSRGLGLAASFLRSSTAPLEAPPAPSSSFAPARESGTAQRRRGGRSGSGSPPFLDLHLRATLPLRLLPRAAAPSGRRGSDGGSQPRLWALPGLAIAGAVQWSLRLCAALPELAVEGAPFSRLECAADSALAPDEAFRSCARSLGLSPGDPRRPLGLDADACAASRAPPASRGAAHVSLSFGWALGERAAHSGGPPGLAGWLRALQPLAPRIALQVAGCGQLARSEAAAGGPLTGSGSQQQQELHDHSRRGRPAQGPLQPLWALATLGRAIAGSAWHAVALQLGGAPQKQPSRRARLLEFASEGAAQQAAALSPRRGSLGSAPPSGDAHGQGVAGRVAALAHAASMPAESRPSGRVSGGRALDANAAYARAAGKAAAAAEALAAAKAASRTLSGLSSPSGLASPPRSGVVSPRSAPAQAPPLAAASSVAFWRKKSEGAAAGAGVAAPTAVPAPAEAQAWRVAAAAAAARSSASRACSVAPSSALSAESSFEERPQPSPADIASYWKQMAAQAKAQGGSAAASPSKK